MHNSLSFSFFFFFSSRRRHTRFDCDWSSDVCSSDLYTLHPGHQSGVIDFHKTDERLPPSDPARYETLAAIQQEELVGNLEAVGQRPIMDLLRLVRPIRLGWIARRRLGVVSFPTEAELDSV